MQHPSKLSLSMLNSLQQITSQPNGQVYKIIQKKLSLLHSKLLISLHNSQDFTYWQQIAVDVQKIYQMMQGLSYTGNAGLSSLVLDQFVELNTQIQQILSYGKQRSSSQIRSVSNNRTRVQDQFELQKSVSPITKTQSNFEQKVERLEAALQQQTEHFNQQQQKLHQEINDLKQVVLQQNEQIEELIIAHNDTTDKVNTYFMNQSTSHQAEFQQPSFQPTENAGQKQNVQQGHVTFSLDEQTILDSPKQQVFSINQSTKQQQENHTQSTNSEKKQKNIYFK